MKITCEARSDVGRKRKGNEDSLFLNPEQKLYVVADGMGGHAAGEVASRVAVDAINEFVTPHRRQRGDHLAVRPRRHRSPTTATA